MSLYRDYRPQLLTDLVGQDHIRQTFLNELKRHALTHAYLFTGPRGTGKTSTARIIARAILCASPRADGEPCNDCAICRDAIAGRLVDLIEIDAASNRGIDEIRDLKEKIAFAPNRAKAKVYIIDEVHMLTKEAFNALLKTLEEPPAHAYFILATTEIHKVPETIVSRCQRFDFHRIGLVETAAHLKTVAEKEGYTVDDEALTLIARESAGGMRDALGLLEQLGGHAHITTETVAAQLGLTRPAAVTDFVGALLQNRTVDALAMIDRLVADGANLIQFTKAVIGRYRELMLVDIAAGQLSSAKELLTSIDIFQRAGEELKSALIPQLPIEMAVVAIATRGMVPSCQPPAANSENHNSSTSNIAVSSSATTKVTKKDNVPAPVAPPSTAVQTLTPEPRAPILMSATTLDVATIAAQLPSIAKTIKAAFVRTALADAHVLSIEHDRVTIGVGSDFLREKLDTPETRHAIADAFSAVLGQTVSVLISRTEISIPTAAPTIPVATKSKIDVSKVDESFFADDGGF